MSPTLAMRNGQRALVLKTLAHPVELRTARTLLRMWKDSDLPAWVAMNADAKVRRHFPTVLSEQEALAEAGRIKENLARRGWGVWALEIPGCVPPLAFAGFVGLHVPTFEAPFMPTVEMGWRLAPQAWGQGWASEAAAAAAAFGFEALGLQELVAYTTPGNAPSRRVMQRLGMTHQETDDFNHPRMAPDHPMCRHVLYRLTPQGFAHRPRDAVSPHTATEPSGLHNGRPPQED